jgi:hypothetical protein
MCEVLRRAVAGVQRLPAEPIGIPLEAVPMDIETTRRR